MKISANLQPQVQGRRSGGGAPARGIPNRDYAQRLGKIDNAQARKTLQNAPMERNLSSAMVVMQKARTIVQQALSVSSKLRANAANTLNTGDVNFQQIGQEMAGINNSFGEFSAGVTPPPVPQMKNLDIEKAGRAVSGLNEMVQRGQVNQDDLKRTERDLQDVRGQLDNGIQGVSRELTGIANSYNAQKPDVEKLGASIVRNYPQALAAQGNISGADAAKLIE